MNTEDQAIVDQADVWSRQKHELELKKLEIECEKEELKHDQIKARIESRSKLFAMFLEKIFAKKDIYNLIDTFSILLFFFITPISLVMIAF